MTQFESTEQVCLKSPQEIYSYVADLANFHQLLPPDRVADFQVESVDPTTKQATSCSFIIKKVSRIGITHKKLTENEEVILSSTKKSGFEFFLQFKIRPQEDGDGSVLQIYFESDTNVLTAMLIERPIKQMMKDMLSFLAN